MSDEPYKVPPGHKVSYQVETVGNKKHTHIYIHRPDGTLERQIDHVETLPSWMFE